MCDNSTIKKQTLDTILTCNTESNGIPLRDHSNVYRQVGQLTLQRI